MGKYDFTIVGAGIIGLSTAYSIIKKNPKSKILILEKERTFSMHQSGNNSNVIHSGIYYKPNSSKAKNCIKGYKLLVRFLKEHNIPFEICGKLIVATKKNEISYLNKLLEYGKKNGLKGLKLLNRAEIKNYEPHVNGIMALHVPQAGITDYKLVCNKIYNLLVNSAGVEFQFNSKVNDIIDYNGNKKILLAKQKFYISKYVINAVGLYSDRLAKISQKNDYKIIPFRGEYYNLKPSANHLVNNLIYPVPNPNFPFLGVHFTRRIDGSIESGPNAVFAYAREGYKKTDFNFNEFIESLTYKGFIYLAIKYWKEGLREMYRSYSKRSYLKSLQDLIPEIKSNDIIKGNAGVRAQAVKNDGSMVDDFMIINKDNIINVCNAPSPAATSCFAIGDYISNLVK